MGARDLSLGQQFLHKSQSGLWVPAGGVGNLVKQGGGGGGSNGLLASLAHYYIGGQTTDSVGSSNFTVNGSSISQSNSNGIITGSSYCNNAGTPGAQTCNTVSDSMQTASVANFTGGSGISFSMSLWVYVFAICQTFTDVASKWTRGSTNPEWSIYETTASVFHFQCENAANNALVGQVFSSSNAPVGTWIHLVAGYDDPNQRIFSYYNGGNFTTSAITGTLSGSAPVLLMGSNVSLNEYQGRIAEFGFWWKRVLSQSDVNLLYNGGVGKPFSQFS